MLNVDGLAKKLHSCGIISGIRTLTEFAHGFGRAQPLFSFIDVGSGKESADHKIRETLRVMIRISQCKHIFFGPCHDNGYLPVLEPYKLDQKVSKKFTLIETTPAEQGFGHLNFPMIRFEEVFRSSKLQERLRVERPAIPPPPSVPTPAKPVPLAHIASSNDVHLEPVVTPPRAASPPSWSTITRTSLTTVKIDIFTKKPTVMEYYLLNGDNQRVDEPLPIVDAATETKFKARTSKNNNFCNNYHLHNSCKNATCLYVHGEKLSSGELVLLKQKVSFDLQNEGTFDL